MLKLYKNIKARRNELGISQEELAKKVGYSSRSMVAKIEAGKIDLYQSKIDEIAKALETTSAALMGYAEESESKSSEEFQEICHLNVSELKHIEKYRQLDDSGKKIIDIMINHEVKRIKSLDEKNTKIELFEKSISRKNTPGSILMRTYPYFHKIACAGTGFYFDDIPVEIMQASVLDGADFLVGVNGDSMEPDYSNGDILYVKKMSEIKRGEVGIFTIGNECFIKEFGGDKLISRNKDYKDIKVNEDVRLIGKVIGKLEEKEENYNG